MTEIDRAVLKRLMKEHIQCSSCRSAVERLWVAAEAAGDRVQAHEDFNNACSASWRGAGEEARFRLYEAERRLVEALERLRQP